MTSRPRRVLEHLLVILVAGALYLAQGPEYVRHPWARLPDGGDSVLNTWALAWLVRALPDPGQSYWDAPIFYPMRNTAALTDPMLGNAWVALPASYLSGSPIFTFHCFLCSSFVLGMYCTFLLVRRLTGSFVAGLTAGAVFSFNPYRWSVVAHSNLLPFFWAPLALLFAHSFLKGYKARPLAGLALTMLAQFYTSINMGIILSITVLVFFCVHFLTEKQGWGRLVLLTDPRLRTTVLVTLALSLLCLVPLALPYVRNAADWNLVRSLAETSSFSCEPLGLVLPGEGFKHYAWLGRLGASVPVRGRCGLGLIPWALAAAGLVLVWRRAGAGADEGRVVCRRFLFTAGVTVVFMLGPFLIHFDQTLRVPLPYYLVFHLLPGAKALRTPSRFVHPLLLCLSVLAGFALARLPSLWRGWRPLPRIALCAAAAALLWLDYSVTDDPGVACAPAEESPAVYDYLASRGQGRALLELPAGPWDQFDYMYHQMAHWRPMLGGNSGNPGPGFAQLGLRTQGAPTDATVRFLAVTPVQTLVIHLQRYPADLQLAWLATDFTPHGFRRVGMVGPSLVWEREGPVPAGSPKLCAVGVEPKVSKGVLYDCLELQMRLTPAAAGLAWRRLDRGLTDVNITARYPDSTERSFSQRFQFPPYLMPGETTAGQSLIGKVRGRFRHATALVLEGPLLERTEVSLQPNTPRAEAINP